MNPTLLTTNTSTQPITATLLANNIGSFPPRISVTLGNLTAGTTFYIKKGASASATNFDFFIAPGQQVWFDDYRGVLTCHPTPTAGQLNVSSGI